MKIVSIGIGEVISGVLLIFAASFTYVEHPIFALIAALVGAADLWFGIQSHEPPRTS